MRKFSTGAIILSISIILSLIILPISGCERSDVNTPEELEPTEIREYEGKKLSSTDDFRENSIQGPQYVNIEDYQLKVTGLVEKPTSYTYNEVIERNQHYKKVVTLNCVEGWSATIL